MARFRKKPVEIEAMQYTADNLGECVDFLGVDIVGWEHNPPRLRIRTLGRVIDCPVGHWIIRGVKGEHNSCDPVTFAATYEAV